jgi:methanogenic corrinoid protein MtbC1
MWTSGYHGCGLDAKDTEMKEVTMKDESRHPIGVVTARTGITQDLLRAWEKRYDAVVPGRGPTGRRLYSDDDIEKLRLLKVLVASGRRISDVARLSRAELLELAREDAAETVQTPAPASHGGKEEYLTEALDALEQFDRTKLQKALSEAAISYSSPELRRRVIVPLLQTIGERWQEGSMRIAHEHLASSIVRTFMAGLMNKSSALPSAPRLIITTPAGQRHELGAMLVAGVAEEYGWDVLYLGPDMPAEEIAAAARQIQPQAIALSIVYKNGDLHVQDELKKLSEYLQSEVPIFVGGRAVGHLRPFFEELGIRIVEDLTDFPDQLQALQN